MPASVRTVMVRVVLISLHPHLLMLSHVTWPMVDSRLERVRCLGNNHYAAGNEETRGGGGHSVTVRSHERGAVWSVLGLGQSRQTEGHNILWN